MSLLTIAQDVAREIGFEAPNYIIGNSDATARQILALCNREGKILSRRMNWSILQKEYAISTIAGQENYNLPLDFDRLIDGTLWDRSSKSRLNEPLSPQQWQQKKSDSLSVGSMRKSFRLKFGTTKLNQFYLDPIPSVSGQNLVFEYISTDWIKNQDATQTRSVWLEDSDNPLLPVDLVSMGICWRFLLAKGLDYTALYSEYEREVEQYIARDGGMPILDLNKSAIIGTTNYNLPESDFVG